MKMSEGPHPPEMASCRRFDKDKMRWQAVFALPAQQMEFP